jgi:hypothetical protein
MILQNIVGRALLNAFDGLEFAERTRNQNDRNVQLLAAQYRDGLHAVPGWQVVVG